MSTKFQGSSVGGKIDFDFGIKYIEGFIFVINVITHSVDCLECVTRDSVSSFQACNQACMDEAQCCQSQGMLEERRGGWYADTICCQQTIGKWMPEKVITMINLLLQF